MSSPKLTLADLPLVRTDELYHLGTLNSAHRVRSQSLEGDCLSASLCPESWEMVARLGGSDLLTLERKNSFYLDMHAANDKLLARMVEEAVEAGHIAPVTWFKLWYYDDEADDWCNMSFLSREEAEAEADEEMAEWEDIPSESGNLIDEVEGHILTDAGIEIIGPRFPIEPIFTHDAAALLLAYRLADEMNDLCGVYWDENDDPDVMSAPRYAILPSRLEDLNVTGPRGEMAFADYVDASSRRSEAEMAP